MMIDVETIDEVLMTHMKIEKDMLDSIDGLVEDLVDEDADKVHIKRTLKSEREGRIKLLNDIRADLIGV